MTPSGYQIELAHSNQSLTVVEVGGGIRDYRVGGEAIIDGYATHEMASSGRGQHLAPWPNRLEDGAYHFAGQDHQLALSEPPAHNAIHGLVRYANWTAVEVSGSSATLAYWLHPQPGYPFSVELSVHYRLDDNGLVVALEAINRGDQRCPFGAGAHPYLRAGTELIDHLEVRSPARTWYRTDDRSLPVERLPVDGTDLDFRTGRLLGSQQIDTAFTDLDRDADGRARVTLSNTGQDQEVTLWLGEAYAYLMLFTGDNLPAVTRRRHGLAVEPMTCAPNAFRSGDGLAVIEPGQVFRGEWGIAASGFSE